MTYEFYLKFSKQFFMTHDIDVNDSIADMEGKYYYYIDNTFNVDNILVQKNLQRATANNDEEYLKFYNSLLGSKNENKIEKIKLKIKVKPVQDIFKPPIISEEPIINNKTEKYMSLSKVIPLFLTELKELGIKKLIKGKTDVNVNENEGIERSTFIKCVNKYIKNHELQNDNDRKMIKIDKTLQKLLPESENIVNGSKTEYNLFDFHKIIHVFWTNNV